MFSNISFPSLFVCFLIFLAWMHYEKRKTQKKENKMTEDFWSREQKANQTRNKDISELPLLSPDINSIPMPPTEDENTLFYQNQLRNRIADPMIDLSSYTNTDLKLAYGVGNFKTLSNYDENFNDFLMNLSNLATAYEKINLLPEAAAVYEFCLEMGSDKTTDYKALAKIYAVLGEHAKLDRIIEKVQKSDNPRLNSLTITLKQM